nr:geraniol 8-hydroxylase-like [Tanacetum cinerariifolium]
FKEVTTIEIDAVETYGNSARGAYIYRTFKVDVRKMACYYTTWLLLQLCSGLFSIPLPVRLALVLKGNGVDVTKHCVPAVPAKRTIRKALNTCLTHQHKLDSLRNLREKVVHGMLEFLRECMRQHEPVDIGKLAFAVALNQMSNTCLSQNVTTYESDDIGGFKTAVKTLMEVDGKFNIADIFPVLKPLDPQNIRRQAKAAYDWFDKVTEGFICTRLKHRESKLPRFGDMLDSLLDYSQDNEADFSLVHIKTLLVDLFLAGTETSSNTTEWAMTELLLNPDMFSKVREEVSAIVGEDGNELDYKGQHFEFIPFGSGRRMCPGIPLAHRVVSLMVASFVYHFEWKLPHAREEMDMNDIFGLTLLRATPLVATPLPVSSHIGRPNLQTTIETQHDFDGLVDQNIPNRGKRQQLPSKYLVTPFTAQPPTTMVPKQRVSKNENKRKKANLSPVNLGGVLEGHNE